MMIRSVTSLLSIKAVLRQTPCIDLYHRLLHPFELRTVIFGTNIEMKMKVEICYLVVG